MYRGKCCSLITYMYFQTPDVPLPETPDPLVDISLGNDDDSNLKDSIDIGALTPNVRSASYLIHQTIIKLKYHHINHI